MDYDEILEELGQFSRWHLLQIALLWLFACTGAFATLCYSFSGLAPDEFRCLIPACNETSESHESVMQYGDTIFALDDDGNTDYCRRYPVMSNLEGKCVNASDFDLTVGDDKLVLCKPDQDIIYGDFGMGSTVVTRFNLVCGDEYKVALTGSIYMSALLVASYTFGTLSDKIGRKKTSFIALLMVAVGILTSSFMPEYISFTVVRFITGFGSLGVFAIPFTLNVELVGNKYKTMAGLLFQVPFALGEILIGLAAMAIRDYRWFQTALAIPCIVMLGLYIIIPESPRWLISKKRYKEAKQVIESAAKFNKVTISPHLLEFPEKEENPTGTDNDTGTKSDQNVELGARDLFKHPGCRNATLIMFVVWTSVTLGYYGISMSATSLNDNIYLAFILSALVELPAYFISILLMDHWGRKPTLIFVLFIGGVCCIPAGFASGTLQTVLSLIGKFGCSGAFCIIYLYTVEIYPTSVRTTGLGLCSMVARLGGIAAPQIAIYLPTVTFDELPMIIFGTTTFIGAIISLGLPETLGAPLVESLDEIYILHKYSKPTFSWWSKAQVNQNIEKINALSTTRRPSRVSKSQ